MFNRLCALKRVKILRENKLSNDQPNDETKFKCERK